MGKLIYSMSVSLDGFVETPSRSIDWVHVDEELHTFFNHEARAMSAFLYGRRMYELMTGYWPTSASDPSATPAEVDFARIWKDKPKVVFSTTLAEVGWNSRLVRDGAVGEVAWLKAQLGFDMDVGGPTLAATLIQAGLVDEYRLYVNPVILAVACRSFRRWRHLRSSGWSRRANSVVASCFCATRRHAWRSNPKAARPSGLLTPRHSRSSRNPISIHCLRTSCCLSLSVGV